MDKAIFKYVMMANGIPVLPWLLVIVTKWQENPAAILDEVESKLSYPVFTKPANLGSSVGISRCENRVALEAGLADAFRYDRRIVHIPSAGLMTLTLGRFHRGRKRPPLASRRVESMKPIVVAPDIDRSILADGGCGPD